MNWQQPLATYVLRNQLQWREWHKWARALQTERETLSPIPDMGSVTASVVQFTVDPVTSPALWRDRVTQAFRQAKAQGAQIIVFGEDIALPLLGVLADRIPGSANQNSLASLAPWLRALANPVYVYWHRTMQVLAKHFAITTVAGSALKKTHSQLFNQSVIFDANGWVIAVQPKMHLLPLEHDLGLSPGADLNPQSFAPWPLVTVVCNDATYFETFRMAWHLGALLVAVPIADSEPLYSEAKARRGTWARVQETPVAGLVGASTGNLFGIKLTGKAAIYLPAALTKDDSGILAESNSPEGEEVITATIDLARLRKLQQEFAYQDLTAHWLNTLYSH
ncbi:MAG: hypothetical protein C7B46_00670 [Sulfobacillus benefaciens]|uniref:CN hydrolase domain-containing protein n=1 Tax=Sulfobacillus benefaciens TaxID=453960 RepID=A0A2T2XM30_9FIRM|nr:MAG: hypothetical protein C7B46_00670 [Sulfobacillus benefaciens]